jgi:hypothetical protein
MNDDPNGCLTSIVVLGVLFAFVGVGYCLGDTFSRAEYKAIGRTEGIIFCLENTKACRVEYDYMQYLKTQQNQK